MACEVISVQTLNAARAKREVQRDCLAIIRNWETALQEIDGLMHRFANASDPVLFDKAAQELAVVRERVVESLIRVQALQIESRMAALQQELAGADGRAG
jgi:hypothetical protein